MGYHKNNISKGTYGEISKVQEEVLEFIDAKDFFEMVLKDSVEIKCVEQENSLINYDIMYKNHELGSYGIRKYENLFQWIYGTGCAEPRLSLIKKI